MPDGASTGPRKIELSTSGFQGGIQGRATGWVKFGARWYNPTTGRWTQQDTLDNPLDLKNAN